MANGAEVTRTGELPQVDARASRAVAFRELAHRHLESSYRLARAILDDPAEAEDATHDAFEAAWRSWGTLRDRSRFEHWFDRILVNTCRNRLRRRRAITFVREIPVGVVDPETAPARFADRDLIQRAMAGLGPDHRVVIALRFYRDLSIDEVAARVGVPAGTVKSRLHYALAALRTAAGVPSEVE